MTILPVAALTSRTDLFRCEPYHANITPRTCIARQGARTAVPPQSPGCAPPRSRDAHPTCVACPVGAEVAARFPDAPAPTAPCVVCGVAVTGAGKREPRCPLHRTKRSA